MALQIKNKVQDILFQKKGRATVSEISKYSLFVKRPNYHYYTTYASRTFSPKPQPIENSKAIKINCHVTLVFCCSVVNLAGTASLIYSDLIYVIKTVACTIRESSPCDSIQPMHNQQQESYITGFGLSLIHKSIYRRKLKKS